MAFTRTVPFECSKCSIPYQPAKLFTFGSKKPIVIGQYWDYTLPVSKPDQQTETPTYIYGRVVVCK